MTRFQTFVIMESENCKFITNNALFWVSASRTQEPGTDVTKSNRKSNDLCTKAIRGWLQGPLQLDTVEVCADALPSSGSGGGLLRLVGNRVSVWREIQLSERFWPWKRETEAEDKSQKSQAWMENMASWELVLAGSLVKSAIWGWPALEEQVEGWILALMASEGPKGYPEAGKGGLLIDRRFLLGIRDL